jgi:hypothetical protein
LRYQKPVERSKMPIWRYVLALPIPSNRMVYFLWKALQYECWADNWRVV